jgi:hypothetical protein
MKFRGPHEKGVFQRQIACRQFVRIDLPPISRSVGFLIRLRERYIFFKDPLLLLLLLLLFNGARAHVGPRPPLMRSRNLTLINNW